MITEKATIISRVEKDCLLDATAGIQWKSADCHFSDWRYLPNINLWRDYLPIEIETQLAGQQQGAIVKHEYAPGELIENFQPDQVKKLSFNQFHPERVNFTTKTPQVGRFYSKDSFTGVDGIYHGNKTPCRVTERYQDSICVDFNHPLAGVPLKLQFKLDRIRSAATERGGRCNDIPALLCDNGPGMQASLAQRQTDFFHDLAFKRLDEADDTVFFSEPDLTPFWDRNALSQVTALYDALLGDGMHILDLMAGVHSPLQESKIQPDTLTCAGLNPLELNANPICTQRCPINVNHKDALADFKDAQFDAILIHAAIEYVNQPEHLMLQIARILKPGGMIIITFSNRSLNRKAIQIWLELHEFERPGLVLNYLKGTRCFSAFNGYSMRGLFRPSSDRLSNELLYSDPVYAIWATRNH